MRLFSTEQISKYHPDKYADQISDAILTECLKQDRHSHCGVECMVKDNTVVLGGEITSAAVIDFEALVRGVADSLGYAVDKVINLIGQQSPEIGGAVDGDENIGAGDQGMMYGYACNDTPAMLPFGFDLANRIIAAIENDISGIFKGDAKCQVTVDLDAPHTMESVDTIVVSVCHNGELDEARNRVVNLLKSLQVPDRVNVIVNPSGAWTIGGPTADCGLTGRKVVCDQYGGYCPVGGGAFSGKDPSKVDRSGAYMARKIACDLLDMQDLAEVEVQLAYAIGVSSPVSVSVKTNRPEQDGALTAYVLMNYDLTPKGIIDALDLYNVDYRKLAQGCHYRGDI